MKCSEQRLEGLAGTAPASIENWILLEYSAAWPKKIHFKDLELSDALREKLQAKHKESGWKFLLIRRPTEKGNRLFWSQSGQIYQTEAEGDWSWESMEYWRKYSEPFFLICTHGNRDRCCGTLGGAIFASMRRQEPNWVWQCSHLGGHRFAPTALSLPDGQCYGRLLPEDVPELLSALNAKEPCLRSKQRGNTRYSKWEQAARIWMEEHYPNSIVLSKDEHSKTIQLQDKEELHWIEMNYRILGYCTPSCGDAKQKEIGEWSATITEAPADRC